jgi:hypothetical protein
LILRMQGKRTRRSDVPRRNAINSYDNG